MSLANGLRVIWLDTYIGIIEEYQAFKAQFQAGLQPTTAMPPNSINELILCFERDIAPIDFVCKEEDALALIQYETDKRIIFISSGTLGELIVPTIVSNYPRVYSIYIFCGCIAAHIHWASEYCACLQMFDHETDLLVRLIRDASKEIIELGKSYMQLRDGESARKCFVTAQTLEINANDADSFNPSFTDHLKILNGDHGLIRQARDMAEQYANNPTGPAATGMSGTVAGMDGLNRQSAVSPVSVQPDSNIGMSIDEK